MNYENMTANGEGKCVPEEDNAGNEYSDNVCRPMTELEKAQGERRTVTASEKSNSRY